MVRAVEGRPEAQAYLDFAREIYDGNACWVEAPREEMLAVLCREIPQSVHCRIQPFWAERGGRIQATVTAVRDDAFNRHWGEEAGHLLFFEARTGADAEARILLDAACDWLRNEGCRYARLSFLYGWQLPLTIDCYDEPPTLFHTYNPPGYHRMIKDSRFYTEKGMVEYRVTFDEGLARQYREAVDRAGAAGVRLRSWDFLRLREEAGRFLENYRDTFSNHWGAPQFTLEEVAGLFAESKDHMNPEFNVFAEADGELVGVVWSLPDLNQLMCGREVDHGMLLSIGVSERMRGKGVNVAMGAKSYLAMIDAGYKSASYTLVLDDNWPSRRTAEKLGCRVARNYVVYRRELVRS
ncbi:MAG: GNAT family N-acetyltransferase [Acidobacteria bacterium]|nr:GNAT family N-acetyltransferase [Acidobacteriota bacterium]